MKKKFRIKKRRVVFSKGPIHLVDCEVVMPDGRVLSRQVLEHPGAVVIIPEIKKDRYLLVRQFRFSAKDWLWEFPAGGLEPGETQKQAAARELIEETGYRPKHLRKLISFYPTPGVSAEVMHVFLARQLVPAQGKPDEDEVIELSEFSLTEIEKMIRRKKIVDGKTILGFYCLQSS